MVRPGGVPPLRLLAPTGFAARRLARMLDSLVRVSRRVVQRHCASASSAQVPRPAYARASPSAPAAAHVLIPRREPALASAPRRRRTSLPFRLWPGRTHCRCTLTPQQFQALFNSLSKVLFIFPSRYLFAIGLSPVFSLRWNLPPDWGCTPKQPDSWTAPRGAAGSEVDGALTLSDVSFQGTWARSAAESASIDYNSGTGSRIFKLGSSRFARRY